MTLTLFKSGKTKRLEALADGTLNVTFTDGVTAFNGEKHAEIPNKGALCAQISAQLFTLLNLAGFNTCFIAPGDAKNQLVFQQLVMIPVEVVVRNVALGSVCKRTPQLPEGHTFSAPVVEFFLKDDAAGDPLLSTGVLQELNLLPSGITPALLERTALQINAILKAYFNALGIICADFKLEFGLAHLNGGAPLVIADELSPDNFRLRDRASGQVLDKDVFRKDLADLGQTYQAVYDRIMALPPEQFLADWQPALQPYTVSLQVSRRPEILHPESDAILAAAKALGFTTLDSVAAGKLFQLSLRAASPLAAEQQALQLAEQLLANPVLDNVTLNALNLDAVAAEPICP
ncbi:MAG: phosphoribosylformylglycinamidine synthase subunit PurS [Vampirovibrionales bacterium]|nr:phosphoribosylformylglycinamidine synthase subunit PurS [Vampirovibrionales bacterium]